MEVPDKSGRMRAVKNIVFHCTATSQDTKVSSILKYWKDVKGWNSPGYHFLIEPNGNINRLLPIESVSNGVRGHNVDSIHISYIGGVDDSGRPLDNRTPKQVLSQLQLLIDLKDQFPMANVLGHRDFEGVTKACPSFDVKKWLTHVGFNR